MVRKFEYEETQEVKVVKKVNQEELITEQQIMEYKMEFLENYFTMEFIDYVTPRKDTYGKSFDFRHAATSEESKSVIRGLWGRYSHLFEGSYEDFMGEVMFGVSSAVIQFKESQHTFDYSKVNIAAKCGNTKKEEDNKSFKCKCDGIECFPASDEHLRLHAYIVKAGRTNISVLESHISSYVNMINWKERKGSSIYEMDMQSLDEVRIDGNGEEYTLNDEAGTESDVFHSFGGYVKPHFTIWWSDFIKEQKNLRASTNKRTRQKAVLTGKQLEYIDVMKVDFIGALVAQPKVDMDEDEFERPYGTQEEQYIRSNRKPEHRYTAQNIYNYNLKINKATLDAYYKEFPNGMTFLGMKRSNEKVLLQEVMDIVYKEPEVNPAHKIQKKGKSLTAQNEILSKWIINNLQEDVLQDIIYDKLDGSDMQNIIAAKLSRKKLIDSETLYKFVEAVEKNLSKAELDTTPVKFYKRDEEFIGGKDNKANNEDRKSGAVHVYNANGDLKQIIEPQDIKKKSYKIQRVTMNGLVDIDIFDDNNF